MMKSIIVTNHKGESLEMELRRPELSGLLPYSISGLGGSTANINTQDMVGIDGAFFVSSRKQTRNITLTVKIMATELLTLEESRRLTYKFFETKKPVRLTFVTDKRSCYIDGYTESNEPDIFTNQETTSISIICPDPYFYDSVGRVPTFFSGITPMFTFMDITEPDVIPLKGYVNSTLTQMFSDPEMTDRIIPDDGQVCYGLNTHDYYIYDATNYEFILDEKNNHKGKGFKSAVKTNPPLKQMGDYKTGEINVRTDIHVNYEGEVDTGMYITLHFLGDGPQNIYIYDMYKLESFIHIDDEEFKSLTGDYFKEADEIEICTIVGQKTVRLLRDGVYQNIINCINRDSTWLQLTKGDNYYSYTATDLTKISCQIDHLVQYEGV